MTNLTLVECNQMRKYNHDDGMVVHWKIDKEVFWEKKENGIENHRITP